MLFSKVRSTHTRRILCRVSGLVPSLTPMSLLPCLHLRASVSMMLLLSPFPPVHLSLECRYSGLWLSSLIQIYDAHCAINLMFLMRSPPLFYHLFTLYRLLPYTAFFPLIFFLLFAFYGFLLLLHLIFPVLAQESDHHFLLFQGISSLTILYPSLSSFL